MINVLCDYFKTKYPYISRKILGLYIMSSLKFFRSLDGFVDIKRINNLFLSGLRNKSFTKACFDFCVYKKYDLFLKYKKDFEYLDEILFKDVINIDESSYKYFLGVYNMPAFIRDLEENCWERLYNPVEYTKDFILLFKRKDYILTLSLISFGKVRVVVYNNDMDSQLLYEGEILCYDPIIDSINI